ncbi:MAG: hypothetical protein IKV16_04545 [Clostridia bacterium]|nr:hypothetical protein [Clostridia bacterium]
MSDYILESTHNSLDRTAEIEAMLNERGACMLGCGVFYVSGIKMPDGASIRGMGAATKIILNSSVTDGAAISLAGFSTVRDVFLLGSEGEAEIPAEVGTRHGILFEGTATEEHYEGAQPTHSMVSGCFISAFSGGGITCRCTGYSPESSLSVSDCQIFLCGVGINIPYFSEYHSFTSVKCNRNLYGCINNGGNNIFTNCGFDCNKTGFVIDNSHGQSNNNSHGSVVGCTFNHSDSNKGVGILLLGVSHGYVFSACQLFFSKVVIENSTGLVFDSFNCGREVEISVKGKHPRGTGLVTFSGSAFNPAPKISVSDNDSVKFISCFTADGKELTL